MQASCWHGTGGEPHYRSCGSVVRGSSAPHGSRWRSCSAPALRRTTALLQLVWTADTFVYYGVVLLAATVRSLFLHRCSTTLAIMQLLAMQNRPYPWLTGCSIIKPLERQFALC